MKMFAVFVPFCFFGSFGENIASVYAALGCFKNFKVNFYLNLRFRSHRTVLMDSISKDVIKISESATVEIQLPRYIIFSIQAFVCSCKSSKNIIVWEITSRRIIRKSSFEIP